jgi:hypothetical protein
VIKVTDLRIDPRSIGQELYLIEVTPVNAWKNGEKMNEIIGYKYVVASKEHGLKKIAVKIEGRKQLETHEDFPSVEFNGLDVTMYWNSGQLQVAAKATSIALKNKGDKLIKTVTS